MAIFSLRKGPSITGASPRRITRIAKISTLGRRPSRPLVLAGSALPLEQAALSAGLVLRQDASF
jgi:hypothetical protein